MRKAVNLIIIAALSCLLFGCVFDRDITVECIDFESKAPISDAYVALWIPSLFATIHSKKLRNAPREGPTDADGRWHTTVQVDTSFFIQVCHDDYVDEWDKQSRDWHTIDLCQPDNVFTIELRPKKTDLPDG
ncbi:MAG: hypothetical protein RLN60_01485 [Phycisphaerales bacterium]